MTSTLYMFITSIDSCLHLDFSSSTSFVRLVFSRSSVSTRRARCTLRSINNRVLRPASSKNHAITHLRLKLEEKTAHLHNIMLMTRPLLESSLGVGRNIGAVAVREENLLRVFFLLNCDVTDKTPSAESYIYLLFKHYFHSFTLYSHTMCSLTSH